MWMFMISKKGSNPTDYLDMVRFNATELDTIC